MFRNEGLCIRGTRLNLSASRIRSKKLKVSLFFINLNAPNLVSLLEPNAKGTWISIEDCHIVEERLTDYLTILTYVSELSDSEKAEYIATFRDNSSMPLFLYDIYDNRNSRLPKLKSHLEKCFRTKPDLIELLDQVMMSIQQEEDCSYMDRGRCKDKKGDTDLKRAKRTKKYNVTHKKAIKRQKLEESKLAKNAHGAAEKLADSPSKDSDKSATNASWMNSDVKSDNAAPAVSIVRTTRPDELNIPIGAVMPYQMGLMDPSMFYKPNNPFINSGMYPLDFIKSVIFND